MPEDYRKYMHLGAHPGVSPKEFAGLLGMDPAKQNRPGLIPVYENDEWIAPQWLYEGVRGLLGVPAAAVTGGPISQDDVTAGLLSMPVASAPVPKGGLGMATVWHGSPHKFDRFDMSKVGVGEGNQAFGHGLYFADNPSVARSYQSAGSNVFGNIADNIYDAIGLDIDELDMLDVVYGMAKDRDTKEFGKFLRETPGVRLPGGGLSEDNIMSAMKRIAPDGNLYKVDIPDGAIAKMLDWDKPYRKQPKAVKDIFKERGFTAETFVGPKSLHNQPSVESLLRHLEMSMGPEKYPEYLKSKGILGIKYLDGMSRKGGTGTRNYVVFDDKLPKILGSD